MILQTQSQARQLPTRLSHAPMPVVLGHLQNTVTYVGTPPRTNRLCRSLPQLAQLPLSPDYISHFLTPAYSLSLPPTMLASRANISFICLIRCQFANY